MTDGNLKITCIFTESCILLHPQEKNTLLYAVTELLNNAMYDKIMGSCKQN